MKSFVSLFTVVCLLTACHSLPTTDEMRRRMRDGEGLPAPSAGASEMTEVPELRLPTRLGIAPPLRVGAEHRGNPLGTWTERERAVIESWAEKFKEAGVISELVFLPPIMVGSRVTNASVFETVRRAAASSHIDTVLVVRSIADHGHHPNLLSILDLTIVGMFVLPGHDVAARACTEAVLIDSTSPAVFAFAEAWGEAGGSTTFVTSEEGTDRLLDEAGANALERLGERLRDQTQASIARSLGGVRPDRLIDKR